jgi:quercetin dioxygenase-like cupin family protein
MGFSEAPATSALRPTFDDVAKAVDAFIAEHASGQIVLYMHDFGGPIGMRIATAHPDRIAGLIFQNTTISLEGWNAERLPFYQQIGGPETPEKLAQAEQLATVARDMFLHRTGAHRPDDLDPSNWAMDAYAFSIPASRLFMSRLLMNMEANFAHYPEWNAYLKDRQPKTLIVWGRNDPFLLPAAAELVKQNVATAELRYFDGSHFALDEHTQAIADAIVETFSRAQAQQPESPGTRRTTLQQRDLSAPGREVIQVRVDFDPGYLAPKHTHPGEEIIYVLEGTLEYDIGGQRSTVKAGDVLFVPAGVVHSAKNIGSDNGAELATYVVEKGKPLVTLVK